MNTIYNELNNVLQEFNRLGIAEQFDFQKLYLYWAHLPPADEYDTDGEGVASKHFEEGKQG